MCSHEILLYLYPNREWDYDMLTWRLPIEALIAREIVPHDFLNKIPSDNIEWYTMVEQPRALEAWVHTQELVRYRNAHTVFENMDLFRKHESNRGSYEEVYSIKEYYDSLDYNIHVEWKNVKDLPFSRSYEWKNKLSHQITIEEVLEDVERFSKKDWTAISLNPKVATRSNIAKYPQLVDKWDIEAFRLNPASFYDPTKKYSDTQYIVVPTLNKEIDFRWTWAPVSQLNNQTMLEMFLNNPYNNWYLGSFSGYRNFTLDILMKIINDRDLEWTHSDLQWEHISSRPDIVTWEVLTNEEYAPLHKKLTWGGLSCNTAVVTMDRVLNYEPFRNKWVKNCIFCNSNLTFYELKQMFDLSECSYNEWRYISMNTNLEWQDIVHNPEYMDRWNWKELSQNPMRGLNHIRKIQRWWRKVSPRNVHRRKYYYVMLAIRMNPYIEHSDFMKEYLEEADRLINKRSRYE